MNGAVEFSLHSNVYGGVPPLPLRRKLARPFLVWILLRRALCSRGGSAPVRIGLRRRCRSRCTHCRCCCDRCTARRLERTCPRMTVRHRRRHRHSRAPNPGCRRCLRGNHRRPRLLLQRRSTRCRVPRLRHRRRRRFVETRPRGHDDRPLPRCPARRIPRQLGLHPRSRRPRSVAALRGATLEP